MIRWTRDLKPVTSAAMRRTIILALLAIAVLAVPAEAATRPPTAMQLVNRLIKAGVCIGPVQSIDTLGISKSCKDSGGFAIKVSAYPSRSRMLRALDAARIAACGEAQRLLGSRQDSTTFTVAKTWWTNSFIDRTGIPLRSAIGGTVKTYSCP